MNYIYLALFLLVSCASTAHKVSEVDNEIEIKGRSTDGLIGITSSGHLIIQEETAADDELRVQQMVNERYQDDLEREYYLLKMCRNELADPRLGGEGQLKELPSIYDLKGKESITEQMGLDRKDKSLKFIKTKFFDEALENERKYANSLKTMTRTVKGYREQCDMNLIVAKHSHSLEIADKK